MPVKAHKNFLKKFIKFQFEFKINYFASYRYCSLQHFSQNYNLASHNTHVVCVDFICGWVPPLTSTLHGNVIFTPSFCTRNLSRDLNHWLASKKPT